MQKLIQWAALWAVCGAVWASSGGLDVHGCHGPKNGGYHCHGVKLEDIRAYIPFETNQARTVRLVAQCKGKKNEGVCKGYVYP